MNLQELEGKTLEELRSINDAMNTERSEKLGVLKNENKTAIREAKQETEDADIEYQNLVNEIHLTYAHERDALDDEYREWGVTIGDASRKRNIAESEEEVQVWTERIEMCMKNRKEIRDKKYDLNTEFQRKLSEAKKKYTEARRERGERIEQIHAANREKQQAIIREYDEAFEQVRKHIARVKAQICA